MTGSADWQRRGTGRPPMEEPELAAGTLQSQSQEGVKSAKTPPPHQPVLVQKGDSSQRGQGTHQGHPTDNRQRKSLLRASIQQRQVPGTPLWAREDSQPGHALLPRARPSGGGGLPS